MHTIPMEMHKKRLLSASKGSSAALGGGTQAPSTTDGEGDA